MYDWITASYYIGDRFQSTLSGRIQYFNERNDSWKNQYSIKFDT